MDLSSYLGKYFEFDENLKQAKLEKENAEALYDVATDYWQNTLELRPTRYMRNFSTENNFIPDFEERRNGIFGSMSQLLPTGTALTAEATHYFDKANPAVPGLNANYKLTFEQSLWQNSFGSLYRRREEAADSRVQFRQLAIDRTWMESCLSGLELFLNSYVAQEGYEIAKQSLEDAEKALKIAKRGFNQRLLRRIDYLNANTDFLQTRNNLLKAQGDYLKFLAQLKVKLNEPSDLVLKLREPEIFFSSLQTPRVFDTENVVAIQSLLAQSESQKSAYLATKNENRSLVNLGASAAQRRSLLGNSVAFGEGQEDVYEVYIRLQLPLINKTRSGNIDSAFQQWKMAEVEAQRTTREFRNQFEQSRVDLEQQQSSLEVSLENIKLRSQQLAEALRLLQAGRIEFDNYARFRDSFFNEKINALRIKAGIWQNKSRLAQFDKSLLNRCQEKM